MEGQNADKVTSSYKVCYKTDMEHFRANCIATKIQT